MLKIDVRILYNLQQFHIMKLYILSMNKDLNFYAIHTLKKKTYFQLNIPLRTD